jgi:hypothetical protein
MTCVPTLALPLQEELDPGAVVAMGVPLSGQQPLLRTSFDAQPSSDL